MDDIQRGALRLRRMRALLALLVSVLVGETAYAGGTTTEVGRFTPYRETSQPAIVLEVRRDLNPTTMNGAALSCFDEHAVESVHFWGLQKADLVRLRALIDAAIAELEKK